MVKPSVLSLGIGVGAVMLAGSGFAIPTLWSKARQAEDEVVNVRNELTASWQEQHDALVASEEARQAATEMIALLRVQRQTDQAELAKLEEARQQLADQLAAVEAGRRDELAGPVAAEASEGEMTALVQQLQRLRSENASLLAQRAAGWRTEEAEPTSAAEKEAETGSAAVADTKETAPVTDPSAADLAASARPVADDPRAAGLVPVPPPSEAAGGGTPTAAPNATASAGKPAANSQTTSKPAAFPVVRFDDSGWTAAAPVAAVSGFGSVPVLNAPLVQPAGFAAPVIRYGTASPVIGSGTAVPVTPFDSSPPTVIYVP